MANKSVLASIVGKLMPVATAKNREGARAYAYTARHRTFYANAEGQLADALAVLPEIEVEFIAKTAIYAQQYGHIKDMPADHRAGVRGLQARLLGSRSELAVPDADFPAPLEGAMANDCRKSRLSPEPVDDE